LRADSTVRRTIRGGVPHANRLTACRYWWVNQNQTYRHEIAGGYLWSPRKADNHRNPFTVHARGSRLAILSSRFWRHTHSRLESLARIASRKSQPTSLAPPVRTGKQSVEGRRQFSRARESNSAEDHIKTPRLPTDNNSPLAAQRRWFGRMSPHKCEFRVAAIVFRLIGSEANQCGPRDCGNPSGAPKSGARAALESGNIVLKRPFARIVGCRTEREALVQADVARAYLRQCSGHPACMLE